MKFHVFRFLSSKMHKVTKFHIFRFVLSRMHTKSQNSTFFDFCCQECTQGRQKCKRCKNAMSMLRTSSIHGILSCNPFCFGLSFDCNSSSIHSGLLFRDSPRWRLRLKLAHVFCLRISAQKVAKSFSLVQVRPCWLPLQMAKTSWRVKFFSASCQEQCFQVQNCIRFLNIVAFKEASPPFAASGTLDR